MRRYPGLPPRLLHLSFPLLPPHTHTCPLPPPPTPYLLCSLAYVVGFTMGPFVPAERPWKPFNPILGETFEWAKPGTGVKYIAEQVGVGAGVWWRGVFQVCGRGRVMLLA